MGSSAWPVIAHIIIYVYNNNTKKFTEGGRDACIMMAAAAVYKIVRLRRMREGDVVWGCKCETARRWRRWRHVRRARKKHSKFMCFYLARFFGWAGGGFAQPFKNTAYILLLRTQFSSSVCALSVEKIK